jgi:hypothetical protein
MFKGKVVAFALVLLIATSAFAGDVDDCYSTAGVSCTGMQVSICPAGDFEFIRNGCGGVADYIWIEARDASNNPVPGIPWTDYWLGSCDPTKPLCLCASPVTADSLTGANGRTTFSGRIRGGGCVLTGGIWWAIQGKVIKAATGPPPCDPTPLCLTDVIIKSPDLTGAVGTGYPDCIVDLSDLIPFGATYNKGPANPGYNACCDYNDDNFVDLSDFAFFGVHYQHRCL